jgi:hypothetical protein
LNGLFQAHVLRSALGETDGRRWPVTHLSATGRPALKYCGKVSRPLGVPAAT